MKYLSGAHMVCLEKAELELLYKQDKLPHIEAEIQKRGHSIGYLAQNPEEMENIASFLSDKLLRDKDEVEIFAALFSQLEFYPDGSKVCFKLDDTVDLRKNPITTLEELKSSTKENDITDFGIMSDGGLRSFQLKQYRGELSTGGLREFIQAKLEHYGGDMGRINLLVILQTEENNIGVIDFTGLSESLNKLDLAAKSEVLISYNENNQFSVCTSVYPELGTVRVPLILPSQRD